MAACASCGEPLRDGVWICGACGAPVAAGGPAAPDPYAEASVSSLPAAPPSAATHGLTDLTKLVLIGGLVAVLAIAGVWFFLLRGAADTYFVGTWNSTNGEQFRIDRVGGSQHLFLIGPNGQSVGPFKTAVKGEVLQTTLEPAGGSSQEKATANLWHAAMLNGSISFEFRRGDDGDHATLWVTGLTGTPSAKQAASLTREQ